MITRLLILDSQTIVRIGMRKILEQYADIEVVADFGLPLPSENDLRVHNPHVVIGGGLPSTSEHLRYIRSLKQIQPNLKYIALANSPSEWFALRSLEAGADGFLHKNVTEEILLDAIYTVARNEQYFAPEVANSVGVRRKDSTRDPIRSLTPREFQVIEMLCKGQSNKEIAKILFISPKTVDNHRANILDKLSLKNNIALLHFAQDNGLL